MTVRSKAYFEGLFITGYTVTQADFADLFDTMFSFGYGSVSGDIKITGVASPPTGWLMCDGSSLVRATYPSLFTAIGVAFGSADGTHFNLPDFRNKFPVGAGTTYAVGGTGGAATHSHTLTDAVIAVSVSDFNYTPVAETGAGGNQVVGANEMALPTVTTDTTISGSTDAASSLPPYLGINFMIKI